jgi:hypothetical protein
VGKIDLQAVIKEYARICRIARVLEDGVTPASRVGLLA